MHGRTQQIIQEQVTIGHFGAAAIQDQLTAQAGLRCRSGRLPTMIRLRCAQGHQSICTLREGLPHQKLQLPRLVSAHCQPGLVIAFNPQFRTTQSLGQPPQGCDRRW